MVKPKVVQIIYEGMELAVLYSDGEVWAYLKDDATGKFEWKKVTLPK